MFACSRIWSFNDLGGGLVVGAAQGGRRRGASPRTGYWSRSMVISRKGSSMWSIYYGQPHPEMARTIRGGVSVGKARRKLGRSPEERSAVVRSATNRQSAKFLSSLCNRTDGECWPTLLWMVCGGDNILGDCTVQCIKDSIVEWNFFAVVFWNFFPFRLALVE